MKPPQTNLLEPYSESVLRRIAEMPLCMVGLRDLEGLLREGSHGKNGNPLGLGGEGSGWT